MKTAFLSFQLFLLAPMLAADLTPMEEESLRFMREEEKLARDVYLDLDVVYNVNPFPNIANSEQRHMNSVLNLLNLYGLEDPALGDRGQFANPDLQAMYDSLMLTGNRSLAAALFVGVLIEETDIADLEESILATGNADLIRVFSNLLAGSIKHLSAFSGALAAEAGFSGAYYQDLWFETYMGWYRLEAFPWLVSPTGQWSYHMPSPTGGRSVWNRQNGWFWTSEKLYPWCYSLDTENWFVDS